MNIPAIMLVVFFLSGLCISAASAQNSAPPQRLSGGETGRDTTQPAPAAAGYAASAEEKSRSPWSFEPALTTGYVYEFSQLAQPYTGWEVTVDYDAKQWLLRGRYRSERYVMSYFGVSQEAINQIFSGQPLSMPVLSRVDVAEEKTDEELLAGYTVRRNSLIVFAGARRMELKNAFSSVDTTGPSFQVEGRWDAGWTRFLYRLNGAFFIHTTIDNHAANDYYLPTGERTISYAGEPRGLTRWELSFNPFLKKAKSLSLGYEGSVIFLKYSYRYSHGLVLRVAF